MTIGSQQEPVVTDVEVGTQIRHPAGGYGSRHYFFNVGTLYERLPGEAAFEKDKFHLDGKVSLTLALNQNKYGDELIAQCFGQAGSIKPRRASRYCRVQVYLGKADLATAETLGNRKKIR